MDMGGYGVPNGVSILVRMILDTSRKTSNVCVGCWNGETKLSAIVIRLLRPDCNDSQLDTMWIVIWKDKGDECIGFVVLNLS